MKRGEPVFLCFCGMTNFHRFKLGFDRTFWIDEIADKSQETIYQVAVESQAAALSVLRPGVKAEEVHAAYAEVIQSAGYEYPFRCGRGTGFSFLEKSQLVFGDKFDFATRNGAYRRWSCQCEKNFPGTGGRQFYRHRKRL